MILRKTLREILGKMFHKILRKMYYKILRKTLREILRKMLRKILGSDEMRRVKSLTRGQTISKISSCVKVIRTDETAKNCSTYFTTLKCE